MLIYNWVSLWFAPFTTLQISLQSSTILSLRYFVLNVLWKTIVEFLPVTVLSKLSFCIDNSAVDEYRPCNTLIILNTALHVNGTVLKYLCSCHVVDLLDINI